MKICILDLTRCQNISSCCREKCLVFSHLFRHLNSNISPRILVQKCNRNQYCRFPIQAEPRLLLLIAYSSELTIPPPFILSDTATCNLCHWEDLHQPKHSSSKGRREWQLSAALLVHLMLRQTEVRYLRKLN